MTEQGTFSFASRAERKAGRLLERMERQHRGGDRKSKSQDVTLIPDLEELGVTKHQSLWLTPAVQAQIDEAFENLMQLARGE